MDFFFLLTLGGRSFLEILHLPNKNADVSVSPSISYLDLFKPTSFSTWKLSKITLQKKEKINKFFICGKPIPPIKSMEIIYWFTPSRIYLLPWRIRKLFFLISLYSEPHHNLEGI